MSEIFDSSCESSTDFLLKNSFRLVIPKLPEVNMYVQSTDLPSIKIAALEQPTNVYDLHQPASKMSFDSLICSFMVDRNLTNYRTIEQWMRKNINGSSKPTETDNILLHITSANTIRFYNAWPSDLGRLSFDVTSTEPQTCEVLFSYDYWEFV